MLRKDLTFLGVDSSEDDPSENELILIVFSLEVLDGVRGSEVFGIEFSGHFRESVGLYSLISWCMSTD